ncbi:DUF2254 domain-containing protein [Zobellia amurskyensis]|uniref:DUF2254 domain-containing protein n=1 Tax=Zobellia amurskyensis TaxID=248905 RepID=A0A7X2ZWQ9_9FLAO|nr:DUF2254 domain-containing protein [Zobellia amurskyensis]MUH37817.1 DUF2254 domain-containing protein [Zobellia amurskyensis]
MKKIIKFLQKTYREVLRSIAFYPVLISILCVILAMLALTLENWKITQSIKDNIPYLFIQDYETARSILSVFIGGIISLTVFSFSMVMVVLSQASSNFSPRLLPGLISNSKHQFILGTYVGTLLYCIIILTSLGARGIEANTMGLSTMLAAILCVLCIGLFVYFIHSISGAIQIHNIIDKIFDKCNGYAEHELTNSQVSKIALQYIDTSEWIVLNSKKTGYFRGFDSRLLEKSIEKQENQIEIIPYLNKHLWEGMPILRIRETVSNDELENLMFCIDISSDRHENDKGVGGMIKLMEIAVKAMSPGINDPGTAIDAIAKLGRLLRKYLQFPHITSQPVENGKCILIKHNITASELMRIIIQPIRLYAKQDSAVMHELIGALQFITKGPNISDENRSVVFTELECLKEDIKNHIGNETDKDHLLKLYEKGIIEF